METEEIQHFLSHYGSFALKQILQDKILMSGFIYLEFPVLEAGIIWGQELFR